MIAAAAYRIADLRQMTAEESTESAEHDRQFAPASPDSWRPFRLLILGEQVVEGDEHGCDGRRTLCGIPADELVLVRHHFHPANRQACPACAEQFRRINRWNEAIVFAENIALAPPRSTVEIVHFARALASLPQSGAVVELSDALEVFQPTDFPDAHMVGLAGLRSAARDALHEMDHHALCVHDMAVSLRPEWAAPQTSSREGAVRSVDWSAQDADDPAGYQKLRRFLADVADSLDRLERPATAAALRGWTTTAAGSLSELLGESALTMRSELMQRQVAGPLRDELEKCVAAIRQGFLHIGDRPGF